MNKISRPVNKNSDNLLGYNKDSQSPAAENSSNKEPFTGSDEKLLLQNSALRKSPADVEQSD